MKKRIGLSEIAQMAGVTRMTVSRYFHTPKSVAPATRERIAAAVEKTGFIPSRLPTMMSKSRSGTVGLIVPSFSNGVFSDIIDAADEAARAHGASLLLMHSGYDPQAEEAHVAALLSYRADAVILCGAEHTELTRRRLKSAAIPVAELLSVTSMPLGISYGIDYEALFLRMTKTLIGCGRKRIVYLGAQLDPRTLLRQRGYETAMKEAGLKPRSLDTRRRSNFTVGRDLMLEVASKGPLPDCVLCTNDDVALGALIACQSLEISVPETLSVIGCNGLNFCDAAMPSLVSIKTPRREIAEAACQRLFENLASGKSEPEIKKWRCTLRKGGSATEKEQQALSEALSSL